MTCIFHFRLGAAQARQAGREKRGWVGRRLTQGGGLDGLALGYYQAAPLGLRNGEPAGFTGRGERIRFVFQ
jgi:hypothetical protein